MALPQPGWSQTTFEDEEFVASGNSKKNRKRQGRPVSMGTSGSNWQSWEVEGIFIFCAGATLGALLEQQDGDETLYYVLGTNTGIGGTNKGKKGDDILQPGLPDTKPEACERDEGEAIAELTGLKKIKFGNKNNRADVAIAETVPEAVKTSGTIINIGQPSSETKNATVDMKVKKSGAGSGVTKGTVAVTNVTVTVGLVQGIGIGGEARPAKFTKQIAVVTNNVNQKFIDAGDGGALVVEDKNNCPAPVGLLAFTNPTGQVGIVNPIKEVLKAAKNIKPKGNKTIAGCAAAASASNESYVDPITREALHEAVRAKRRAERKILEIPGVTGIGVSMDARDRAVIRVLLEYDDEELRSKIPAEIDGVVTDVMVTGPFTKVF